jgi:hypothetical protein
MDRKVGRQTGGSIGGWRDREMDRMEGMDEQREMEELMDGEKVGHRDRGIKRQNDREMERMIEKQNDSYMEGQ